MANVMVVDRCLVCILAVNDEDHAFACDECGRWQHIWCFQPGKYGMTINSNTLIVTCHFKCDFQCNFSNQLAIVRMFKP